METLNVLFDRRSIRQYTGVPVTDEQLHTILEAAMYAPSAMKRIPWHFVVLNDPAQLAKIPEVHPYAKFAVEAGCAVVVCADRALNDNITHLTQDTSAAIENMLIAAKAMGLGTCWCGVYSNEERTEGMRKICGIENPDIIPMSLVVIGNPAAEPERPVRWDDSRVHTNRW